MKLKTLLGESNAKTIKGEDLGYLTGILYMAPANTVDGINVCRFASNGCKNACLYSAGRGRFSSVQRARIIKTELFRDNLEFFMISLVDNINKIINKAKRKGLTPAIRLNGTSDIRYEDIKDKNGNNIFSLFPNIQFYDYTKDFTRFNSPIPKNYNLTFSVSEGNIQHLKRVLRMGINAAMVFFNEVPKKWMGNLVIDGDLHDLRFLDGNKGVIVGLKAKGEAKNDKSGFVRDINFDLLKDVKAFSV